MYDYYKTIILVKFRYLLKYIIISFILSFIVRTFRLVNR